MIGVPDVIKVNLTDGFSFAWFNLVKNRLFIHVFRAVGFSCVRFDIPNGFVSAIGLFVKVGAQNTECSIGSGHNTIVACACELFV
jgi:hypothetical protein